MRLFTVRSYCDHCKNAAKHMKFGTVITLNNPKRYL
jgi:hypothetical protein